MNWIYEKSDDKVWIKDINSGRFTNIYAYPDWAEGNKYGIVDDTGLIRFACSDNECREIVNNFFTENKPDELEDIMRKCGYVKLGYTG